MVMEMAMVMMTMMTMMITMMIVHETRPMVIMMRMNCR